MSLRHLLFIAALLVVGGCTLAPIEPCLTQQPVTQRTALVAAHDESPGNGTVQCVPDSPSQP